MKIKRLLVLLWMVSGCAYLPQLGANDKTFQATRVAFIEVAGDYHEALAKDNATVKACYAANANLSRTLRKEKCPPKLSPAARNNAARAIHVADSAIVIIDSQLSLGIPPDAEQVKKVEDAITSLSTIVRN